MMKLYDYFRSTAAYRVRIALHYKELSFKQIPVHLVKNGGEQFSENYRNVNPQSKVPVLEVGGHYLIQSLAIIEYLEEEYPAPALLPKDAIKRAEMRAVAQLIACDIHPLNNIRVLNYLTQNLHLSEEQKMQWYRHWIHDGLSALEKILYEAGKKKLFCFDNTMTLADVCLIPQLYNAHRFKCPVDAYPTLNRIYEHCLTLPYFNAAHPDKQPDAE